MIELLDRLGIAELRSRHIRDLSGGQQQRVFLARALIRRPELLLLDEPTSGVDVKTRQEILSLLQGLNESGIGVLLATHDLNSVATTLPHLVCVNGRIVAEGSPADVFTPDVLRQTFGSNMVVFHHDGALLTADAPLEEVDRQHHAHLHHGPAHEGAWSPPRATGGSF
jgi:zinc/manganese transport system ATP-binding protein/zinc transport system ATP-binding protein